MITEFKCIPCIVNSYLRLIETGVIPESRQEEILRRLLKFLSQVEYDHSPPVLGRILHSMIRESLQDPDPYRQIKEKYNRMMMEQVSQFEGLISGSKDPFDTAMRLAISGNVIDFGSQYLLDIMSVLNQVLSAQLAIDDSLQLRDDLKNATTLLYIGDNCGEIVLDKLFLSFIKLPRMYFVVRDGPVINDVTHIDADMVGMEEVAQVITTGDNAPGAVWESTSTIFKDHFADADVVISKGQGNLEGLMDSAHERIYFLLVTKCDLIADRLGTKTGEFIVKKGASNENNLK